MGKKDLQNLAEDAGSDKAPVIIKQPKPIDDWVYIPGYNFYAHSKLYRPNLNFYEAIEKLEENELFAMTPVQAWGFHKHCKAQKMKAIKSRSTEILDAIVVNGTDLMIRPRRDGTNLTAKETVKGVVSNDPIGIGYNDVNTYGLPRIRSNHEPGKNWRMSGPMNVLNVIAINFKDKYMDITGGAEIHAPVRPCVKVENAFEVIKNWGNLSI